MSKAPDIPTPSIEDIVRLLDEAVDTEAHKAGEDAIETALQGTVAANIERAQELTNTKRRLPDNQK
ncbi:MAG: hypothetical protein O3B47_04015 [bacterium]|nr:hypothetical protein [bacterium]